MQKNNPQSVDLNLLASGDPVMANLIAKYGPPELEPHDRYFEALTRSIVSQQLSVKAAQTIWLRFLQLFDNELPEPARIVSTDDETLRNVGLSYRKVSYIKDLALHIENGDVKIDHFADLSDDEILRELTNVRGLGIWSVHMFMIFSLGRRDVLAWGDLGVRKSAQQLYGLDDLPSHQELEQLSNQNRWSPNQSYACWYLWKALDNK